MNHIPISCSEYEKGPAEMSVSPHLCFSKLQMRFFRDSASLNSPDNKSLISQQIYDTDEIYFANVWFLCYPIPCQECTTNLDSFDSNEVFVFHRFS